MKKWLTLLLTALLLLSLAACGNSQTDGEDSSSDGASDGAREAATEYLYELSDGETAEVADLVFEEDVTISGDNAQITFTNCEFKGNILNTADEGTRVILSQSVLNGQCIFENSVQEATMEWSFPKFITDSPVEVVCTDCIGSVIPMGDFEVVFNGETYTMADSQLFFDLSNSEAGFVPYDGQTANYFCVAQWWENGEQVLMVECEYDPNM